MRIWRQKLRGSLVLFLTAGIGCLSAFADEAPEPIVTDRPDFTESPQTVPRGQVQVESGVTFERADDDRATSFGEVLIRVATGGRSELRIGVPTYVRQKSGGETSSGLDDLFLGGKWVLSSGSGRKPQLALLAGSTLPTGSRRIAERAYQPEAVLAAAMDLTEKVSLSSNLGVSRARVEGERFNQLFGSLSLGYSFNDKWAGYVEAYAFNRVESGGTSQQYINGGLTYLINDDFQLDARLGCGLNQGGESRERFFGFGVARRF